MLEALSVAGVETALFVEPPTAEVLERYPSVRAVGVAGNSRAMAPAEMDATLRPAFEALRELQPRVVHYKVCSTFDSSPEVGSIGRAIDIGHEVFSNRFVPIVVGVPRLQRYCVFGNLFASSGLGSRPFRLDRHPTMRHHPVTPMDEADLRVHLSRQTVRPIELVDVLSLDAGYEAARRELDRITEVHGKAVLFDGLTNEHLALTGRLIWESQATEKKPLFVTGSSGIEYALASHWRSTGVSPQRPSNQKISVEPVDRVIVVSGSCAPVTRRQIAWALENGFGEVRLNVNLLRDGENVSVEATDLIARAIALLESGKSVILHTMPDIGESRNGAPSAHHAVGTEIGSRLGTILGSILGDVLRACLVRRVAVAGGDTSGQVARSLGIESLEMAAPLTPGAPLCIARSRDAAIDGLEMVFKGGQVGYEDFFGTLLRGQPSRQVIGAI